MHQPRLYRRFAVAAIGLLLAGLLPGSVLAVTDPNSVVADTARPLVLYTDIASGPITGGEHNKGIYLSVFGKHFGTSSGIGVSTKVYVGGVEVDNYRYLGASRVSGGLGIDRITVQVGSLGSPKLGTALPVDVKVNGIDSNTNVTFTPNPGKIYFVSNISGNDATGVANDIAHPYRHVQLAETNNNGIAGCPASAGDQPVSTSGVWGIVHPGDFIVMRGGTWTDLGRDDFFLRFQNKSGTAPTGASGSGPISVIGYPTEGVFINLDHNANPSVEGGISSADSARQELGCGSWVTVADLRLESGGREGMLTTQAGYANPAGSHWRVVNNELTAVSVDPNAPAKGAGVAGSGDGELYYGNYIHDVHGGTPEHENHGFYVDGSGSYDIAYNWLKNISGGNGINVYGSSGTDPDNIRFHHNVINGVGKHGLNIGDGAAHDLSFYDNLLYNIANYCVRFNTDSLSGNGVKVWNNTFYGCGTVRDDFGYDAVVANTWGDLPPSLSSLHNNIFVSSTTGPSYIGGSAVGAVSNNLYYGTSDTTSYSSDAHHVVSNPLFTSTTPGSENFVLKAGSPALNAGTTVVSSLLQSTRDLSLDVIRPQGSSYDIGAYESAGSVTPTPSPTSSTYHPITPVRMLDTRSGIGHSGRLTANTPITFQVTGRQGVPAGASAVTGNLTVTGSSAGWAVYLGPKPIASPTSSTINFTSGQTIANGLTVALSTDGKLSATYMGPAGASTELVFDLTGFYTPDKSGETYHSIAPVREVDSRVAKGLSGHLTATTPACFSVAGVSGVPATARAVTGKVTVANPTAAWALYLGYLATSSPSTSTLNFGAGQVASNDATLALSTSGKLCATYLGPAGATTDLVFDVTGYYTADATGAAFVPMAPLRFLDTRSANGLSGRFVANTPRTWLIATRGGIPAGASAITGNLTVTDETAGWAVYVGPAPLVSPSISWLNFLVGDVKAIGVSVALSASGTLSATYLGPARATTDLVLDVTGYFVK